jgi:hypothetical protein
LIQPIPLLLIRWLPAGPEEQKIMQQSKRSSKWGGIVFVTVLFSSLAFTVIQALITIA